MDRLISGVKELLRNCYKWLQVTGPLGPLERVEPKETRFVSVQLVTLGGLDVADLTLPASAQVAALRHRVAHDLGIPPENQRLILGSNVLDDLHRALGDFGESLLITVLRRQRQQALSAGSKDGLGLWDLEGREFSTSLARGLDQVHCIDVCWRQLLCLAGQSCRLVLWDLARDQRLGCYEHGPSLLSHSVEWSNMEVLSCCHAGEIHLWNLKTFETMKALSTKVAVRCMVVDWLSRRVVTCGERMSLWTVDALSKVRDFDLGAVGEVSAVALQWPRCVSADSGPFRAKAASPSAAASRHWCCAWPLAGRRSAWCRAQQMARCGSSAWPPGR